MQTTMSRLRGGLTSQVLLKSLALLTSLMLLSAPTWAEPECRDIFTNPPSGNHFPGLVPPSNLGPSLGKLTCKNDSCNQTQNYVPGNYSFTDVSFQNGNYITTNGASTRLFVNSLTMHNAQVNVGGKASDLIIYVTGSLSIAGNNTLNAIVYVFSAANISGNATLTGAIAAGGGLTISGNRNISVDLSQVDNADFGGMCVKLNCETDDFSGASISNKWTTQAFNNSRLPSLSGGRFNLTQATRDEDTAAFYQYRFPAANNLITIQFDYYAWSTATSLEGGYGLAVIFSDAAVTPTPGGFAGSLGYAPLKPTANSTTTPGFAGGWLGVAIDEHGSFSNPTNGRVGGPGRRTQSVSVRGAQSTNYVYMNGTSSLNPKIDVRASSTAAPGHKYRLRVDSRVAGVTNVSIARNTGDGFVDLISPFNAFSTSGQSALPANFRVSLTASTGGDSNNHEIDNFKVCALESSPLEPSIDHFEFDYSDSPLTCNAEEMTIRACKNADCSQLYTQSVTANLLPTGSVNGGWQGGSQVTLTGGMGKVKLAHTTASSPVTIGVSSSVPAGASLTNTLCRKGTGAKSNAACTLSFADSGFILDVPDKYAGQPETLLLRAVKKDDASKQCVPSFANVTRNVAFWSGYQSPTSAQIIGAPKVTINGTSAATSESAATSIPLSFNASGEAQIAVNYPDAGQVSLNAKYQGSAATSDQGLLMTGSDSFVSSPYGFCITTANNDGVCSSANHTCQAFKKAGESFKLQLLPIAWSANNSNFCNNPTTANFAWSQVPLTHELVAPIGGKLGEKASSAYSHVAKATANEVDQSVSEVGVFKFGTAAFSGYLGSAKQIQPSLSQPLGRFVPASFAVTQSSLTPACSSFSYLDQPTPLAMTIEAKNVSGTTTENYQGLYAKGVASLSGENNDNGVALSSRLSPLGGSWSLGKRVFDVSHTFTFGRTLAPLADGPFDAFDLGLRVDDGDGGMTQLAGMNMKADSSGNCSLPSNTCTAVRLNTSPLKFYHGRVKLDNTYGPEGASLRMKAQTEYWQGSGWTTLAADNCSVVAPTLEKQVDDPLLGYGFNPALVNGQSIVRSASPAEFRAGMLDLYWQSLGAPAYRGQVTAPLRVDDWLKWYWNWDSVSPNQFFDPRSSAYFGRYRGDDRVIFWQEVN